MRDDSTRRDERRPTEGVTALLLSVLLLTATAAPAVGFQVADTPRVTADAVADRYDSTVSHAKGHPAALPDASVTTLGASAGNASASTRRAGNAGVENGSIPANATTRRVTLVTGQTVTVVETDNATRYRVSGDARMHKVSTGNATYVFPVGVDFGKFDRHLFNVDFLVRQNLTDAETDSIPVIVSERERGGFVVAGDGERTGEMLAGVSGVRQTASLRSIDAAAGRIDKDETAAAYLDLKNDDRVGRVTLDVKYRVSAARTDDAVGASDARREYGVSGNDVTVAVLDSGIDESHPAIDRVVDERDFTGDGTPYDAEDVTGHGTHVAGIVASDDETYTGMAPNANLMDVRVLDDDGRGYTSWIVKGIEYAADRNADVISMSIGGPVNAIRSNDRYTEAIDAATERGTLVVVAAGNDGYFGYRTVGTPGIHSKALTVGASNASSGEIADFSSRGPTPYGYYLKPDLVAPGAGVMSAEAGTDGFVAKSGTSMAAPVVSGVAALVLEAHPTWTPAQVRGVLTSTSDPLGSQDAYTQGAGEVDATAALSTNVVVTPATVDFGKLGDDGTVTRTIRVTNFGESAVTLDVTDPRATNVATDESAGDAVTVDTRSVTVGAGNTATVRLGVDTSAVGYGVYSGRVELRDGGGRQYETIFGFARAHEVTVNKRALAGTSTDGDFAWLFAEDRGRFKTVAREGLGQVTDSTVTYHVVSGGKYNLISDGVDEDDGQPIVFSREVSVAGDPTFTLDESNTTAYRLDTSQFPDEHTPLWTRNVQVTYAEGTSYETYVASLSAPYGDTQTVRVNADGEFDAAIEHLLVPESATGGGDNFDAEAVYHLVHRLSETDGTTFSVDPDELDRKRVTYYRSRRGGSYDVTLSARADFPYDRYFDYAITDGIGDRRHQTIYLNRNVVFHGVGATSEAGATPGWHLSRSYTATSGPSTTVDRSVNRHPYTGYANWAFDGGGLDSYYAVAQRDRYHVFNDTASDDVARLTVNDRKVRERRTSEGYFYDVRDRSLNAGDTVELTVVGNDDATTLSTRTVTSLRTTYDPMGDNRPPELYDVAVDDLTTNNTVGGTLTVEFVTHEGSADLDAYVANDAATTPFDGDSTGWRAASVEKVWTIGDATTYRATFDVDREFGEFAGRLDFAVRTTDADGNAFETTAFDSLRADARKPSVTLAAVGADGSPTGVPESGTVYTQDTVTATFDVDGTPGSATFVGGLLSADFANFRTGTAATTSDGRTWTATADLSDVPDDGRYSLTGFARDRLGNRKVADTGVTVVLDRDAPDLGATIERAGNDGKVTLTSDEPLPTTPTAQVATLAGNTETVTLERPSSADDGEYVWEGTFSLAGDSDYTVTASGTDRAGNTGTAESTAAITSVDTDGDRKVTVVLEKLGTFVEFRTSADVSSTVTVTGSRSALVPLTRNLEGLNFLNGQLGTKLTDSLDEATIGIPVNGNLPPGIEKKQVKIHYYDESTGNWEARDTTIQTRTINGVTQEYWVTNVTHFSTYGAVAEDERPPTVSAKSPDGTTLEYGTTRRTVRFEYGDDVSGVDPSAVELSFDGETVTGSDATNVTSEYATYDATGLAAGEHTATLTVADETGKSATYTATFAVAADTTPPRVVSVTPADGATLPAGTKRATLAVSFDDSQSGLDTSTAKATYDGRITVSGASIASGDTVEFTATGLTNGSTHTLDVEIADNEGNVRTKTVRFGVADPEANGGGGGGGRGGGGGNVPPPSVQVEVTDLGSTYAKAAITSARASSPGTVSFDGGLRASGATVRRLTVVPASRNAEARFFVEARTASTAPSGVTAFDVSSEALGYLTVTPTYISDGELETVGVTFDVAAGAVDSPKNVALYRYDGGTWSRVTTTLVRERDGAYRFRASADATGTFAVGVSAASFEVTDAALDSSAVGAGERVTVSATVENVGTGEGTYAAKLRVDGEVVATKRVTLAAGERTTVEFVRTFAPGERVVAVGSAAAGTLAVSSGETTANASDEGAMDDEADRGTKQSGKGASSGTPGFGVGAALTAFAVAALLARRYRR